LIVSNLILLAAVAAIGTASPSSSPQASTAPNNAQDHPPSKSNAAIATPSPSSVAEESAKEGSDKKQNEGAGETPFLDWCRKYESAINLFCAISVAIFSGILTIFTVKLWQSGKAHSERELRAYLFVERAYVKPPIANDYLEAVINLRNGGQTPAYDVTTRFAIWIDDCPSRRFPVGDWTPSTISIGPGCPMDFQPGSAELLSESDRAKIEVGELAAYIAEEICYKDIFDKSHITRQRAFFFNHRQEFSIEGKLPLRPSEDGHGCT
jgi:hypothetical protein